MEKCAELGWKQGDIWLWACRGTQLRCSLCMQQVNEMQKWMRNTWWQRSGKDKQRAQRGRRSEKRRERQRWAFLMLRLEESAGNLTRLRSGRHSKRGNLRLRRQPVTSRGKHVFQAFLPLFLSLSSAHLPFWSLLSHSFIPHSLPLQTFSDCYIRANKSKHWGRIGKVPHVAYLCKSESAVRYCTDNHRTFHSLLPCNICKTLLFPTTPPPSRSLHPRIMHTHTHKHRHSHTHRCRHTHTCRHSILYLLYEW